MTEANDALVAATDGRWPMMTELDAHRLALWELYVLARHYSETGNPHHQPRFERLAQVCFETATAMETLLGGYC